MFVAKLMKNVTIETNSRLGNVPKLVKKELLKSVVFFLFMLKVEGLNPSTSVCVSNKFKLLVL